MTLTSVLIQLIKASLVTVMLGLGLGLRLDQLVAFRHRPWLLLRVSLGSCVLVPLVALLLLKMPWTQQISAGARFGLTLMALSPSAPLTLRKAGLKGGDHHLAALLQVMAALMAIVSVPLLGGLFREVYGVTGWDISPREVAIQVAVVHVLPLSLGLVLRGWKPELGDRWAPPVQRIAWWVAFIVICIILGIVSPQLVGFVWGNGPAILAMVGMTLAALAIGYVLAGQEPRERITTALVISMRNPGLAMLIALSHGREIKGVKLAIVSYLLVTILTSIPFLRWSRRQASS